MMLVVLDATDDSAGALFHSGVDDRSVGFDSNFSNSRLGVVEAGTIRKLSYRELEALNAADRAVYIRAWQRQCRGG